MCDMENPDYQVIELCKKARYKETVRNNRKIEKLKNLHQEDGAVQKLQFLDSFLRFRCNRFNYFRCGCPVTHLLCYVHAF